MTEQQSAPVTPGRPLPGRKLAIFRPFDGYPGPLPVQLSELAMHAKYEETVATDDGGHRARGLGWGAAGTGQEVRNFLGGSLRGWLFAEASVMEDGAIHYRQSKDHSAVTFTPDRESGVIITDPERDVTADAYRVTGHGRTAQVWSTTGLGRSIAEALRPGPFDWPQGWALLMPDQTVRFADRGMPWSPEKVYVAEPVTTPESWGAPCSQCGRFESEHDPKRAWSGCWTHQEGGRD